jgi:hypothetical protein
MPVLTLLNHGTCNASTGHQLLGGDKNLVVSRLEQWMVGAKGSKDADWMINQGVGSGALTKEHENVWGWDQIGGIVWAKGIDDNVDRMVNFVHARAIRHGASNVTVNLAGHSRGSITCFKIAYRLHEKKETKDCPVNVFAIDPVPGNLGCVNNGSYKQIVLQTNVKNAFMILAENEKRNAFRAYVDQVFLQDLPTHQMDTIPGNHGGINELGAALNEAAQMVLHHAVRFLAAHGTPFGDGALVTALKTQPQQLDLYAAIMVKFQEYKAQGARKNNAGFRIAGGVSTDDRNVETKQAKRSLRLGRNVPFLEKNKYRGQKLTSISPFAGLNEGSRFFANRDHKELFRQAFPNTWGYVRLLEGSFKSRTFGAMTQDQAFWGEYQQMSAAVREHVDHWLDLLGQRQAG